MSQVRVNHFSSVLGRRPPSASCTLPASSRTVQNLAILCGRRSMGILTDPFARLLASPAPANPGTGVSTPSSSSTSAPASPGTGVSTPSSSSTSSTTLTSCSDGDSTLNDDGQSSKIDHEQDDADDLGKKAFSTTTLKMKSTLKKEQAAPTFYAPVASSKHVLPTADPNYRPNLAEFWRGGLGDPETDFTEKRKLSWSGDPWPACLLRLKSFEDLHKLWYVCLKEKNFLLGERHFVRQASHSPNVWENHGRLKKVKLTMKRILTVLSRREIHEQALRAKEILKAQQEREVLETKRFHLEEEQKVLDAKIRRLGNTESVSKAAWRVTMEKNHAELEALQAKLLPLRKATMALLIPDWRYSRKYTDLPGTITWKKQWIRALDETRKLPFRFY
ncbi:unnamed protein product [Amoebophrya sp. A25]|nr:unnamed protein product [Amoebophrya sp. A25]|eukprot:GSA25T00006470001.1